jgi:hypothetical protein
MTIRVNSEGWGHVIPTFSCRFYRFLWTQKEFLMETGTGDGPRKNKGNLCFEGAKGFGKKLSQEMTLFDPF